MIKEIFVDGYKSINQESVELKPFTLFSGDTFASESTIQIDGVCSIFMRARVTDYNGDA